MNAPIRNLRAAPKQSPKAIPTTVDWILLWETTREKIRHGSLESICKRNGINTKTVRRWSDKKEKGGKVESPCWKTGANLINYAVTVLNDDELRECGL